jgi:lipoprotein-anchoring transpeptidase ErfK/SrfK
VTTTSSFSAPATPVLAPASPTTGASAAGRRPLRRALLAVTLSLALVGAACSSESSAPTINTDITLPPVANPADAPGTSEVARPRAEGDIVFRSAPADDAPIAATLPNPRPLATDPPVSIPLVLLVAERQGDWLQVYLPIRPNGSTGWLRAEEVTVTTHPWRIEAALDEFRLRVYKNDEVVYETEIGVARDNAPTPGGLYYTTELLQPPDPNTVYGTYAYGLSGFSETFEEFNGGPGQLGLHGTNEPELIGQAVSAGCIRLRNEDIDYLVEQLKLPLGVPVEVVTS